MTQPHSAETPQADRQSLSLFDPKILVPAIGDAFTKLDPRTLVKNPVMFVVEIVVGADHDPLRPRPRRRGASARNALFSGQITLWLWFTVLFANFAEAVAEGRGKAQADTLRQMRTETMAKRLASAQSARIELVGAADAASRATSCWSRPATSSRATAR